MVGGIERSRATNKLTDKRARAFAKEAERGKKLFDGGGLYLIVTPAGTAVWRLKYRIGGKEKTISLGAYPAISLEVARAEREIAKSHVRAGRNPMDVRRVSRAQAAVSSDATFESVAKDWFEMQREAGWAASHFKTSWRAFERDVLPTLGRLPIADIRPVLVSSVVKRILGRGARDTAGKVLNHCDCVFRFARANGMTTDNPARDVHEILPKAKEPKHHPAILNVDGLREVLRLGDVAPLSPSVRLASRLCAFTACRSSNIVSAEWSEFDLDSQPAQWVIPRVKMKKKDRPFDHLVILPDQIAHELREWKARSGGGRYLFPSPRGKRPHISVEGLDKAYSETLNLSGKHCPHGWRAAFKTLAVEEGGFSREATELALDHVHDNAIVRAYDRGERLVERRSLAAWWGEQLAPALAKAPILRLHGAA